MLDKLAPDILKLILSYGSIQEWFEQRIYLICKRIKNLLFSEKFNDLWELECKRNNLDITPVGLWCYEYIKWQNNNLKHRKILKTIFEKKENVFITGGAGVGKSYMLETIKKKLRSSEE